jgi:hypothetical protein
MGFSDSVEAAEYVRTMRLQHTAEVYRLPRSFVRELSTLIEIVSPEAAESDTQIPLDGLTDPAIRLAVASGRLTADRLASWRAGILDELGQIDELLRER